MRIAPKLLVAGLTAMLIVASSTAGASPGSVTARELRVDNTVTPLGTDNPAPAFSWQLTGRGRQTAYRIIVAGVWDSGRVASDESIGIPYGGPPLQSSTRYHWTVQVWDAHGRSTTAASTWWGPDC